jgi:hypothetical protein
VDAGAGAGRPASPDELTVTAQQRFHVEDRGAPTAPCPARDAGLGDVKDLDRAHPGLLPRGPIGRSYRESMTVLVTRPYCGAKSGTRVVIW